MKITVMLESFVPTPYETYNHFYKAVPIEIPENGIEWHVCGEMQPYSCKYDDYCSYGERR